MAAVVPGHDPPTGVREKRRERVERPCEVGTAMHEEHRWRFGIAPRTDGKIHAVGTDPAVAIGSARARKRNREG